MNSTIFEGHTNHRQGAPYVAPKDQHYSGTSIEVLQFLKGREWDQLTLAYVHGLNPTWIRVVSGGTQMDAQRGRVTVYINKTGHIRKIEQEIEVLLPKGVNHGHHLDTIIGR